MGSSELTEWMAYYILENEEGGEVQSKDSQIALLKAAGGG